MKILSYVVLSLLAVTAVFAACYPQYVETDEQGFYKTLSPNGIIQKDDALRYSYSYPKIYPLIPDELRFGSRAEGRDIYLIDTRDIPCTACQDTVYTDVKSGNSQLQSASYSDIASQRRNPCGYQSTEYTTIASQRSSPCGAQTEYTTIRADQRSPCDSQSVTYTDVYSDRKAPCQRQSVEYTDIRSASIPRPCDAQRVQQAGYMPNTLVRIGYEDNRASSIDYTNSLDPDSKRIYPNGPRLDID